MNVNSSVTIVALQQLSDTEFRVKYARVSDNRSPDDPLSRAMEVEHARRQALCEADPEWLRSQSGVHQ